MKRIHIINLELVKTLMKAKGFDQKEMAKQMNITRRATKRFLGGADQRRMSPMILVRLSKALGVSAQSLLQQSRSQNLS